MRQTPDAHPIVDAVAYTDSRPQCDQRLVDDECGSEHPFCCYACLECGGFCSVEPVENCFEFPGDDLATACDTTTGDGCDGENPICCGAQGQTFCTDHAYLGNDWVCSAP